MQAQDLGVCGGQSLFEFLNAFAVGGALTTQGVASVRAWITVPSSAEGACGGDWFSDRCWPRKVSMRLRRSVWA
ncbi:hypothetical protein CTU88_40605 [Streptomyces sp. JV178]|nr:hypothetical protein CTU88_40605 [Streptomyces sp. JV178]